MKLPPQGTKLRGIAEAMIDGGITAQEARAKGLIGEHSLSSKRMKLEDDYGFDIETFGTGTHSSQGGSEIVRYRVVGFYDDAGDYHDLGEER